MLDGLKRWAAQFMALEPRADITSGIPERLPSPGNPYPSYEETVLALDRMYRGVADWGNVTAQNVVDVRAAFTMGDGVQPAEAEGVKEGAAAREIEFLRAFLAWNELDLEEVLNWAREAEIEGKFAVVLRADPLGKQISARFLPWTQHRYEVESDPADYAVYRRLSYKTNGTGKLNTLQEGDFVFRPFGGRTHTVDNPTPKAGHVLRNMEALDCALYDWREINHLFASPFPVFKCASQSAVKETTRLLRENRWKVGKALVTDAEVSMLGAPMGGVDSIYKEIETNTKIISGLTGVPAHFLGFPDLLSNRSTSDNLFEALTVSVAKERKVWIGFYQELFQAAIRLYNKTFSGALRPELVTAKIAEADKARLEMLGTVWLPLYQGGALSLRSLLERIPGVDPTAEEKAIGEAAAKRAKDMADQFGGGAHDHGDDDDEE